MDQDLHRPALVRAIVDRLTYGGNIIEIGKIFSTDRCDEKTTSVRRETG
jgi:hypothetical protein